MDRDLGFIIISVIQHLLKEDSNINRVILFLFKQHNLGYKLIQLQLSDKCKVGQIQGFLGAFLKPKPEFFIEVRLIKRGNNYYRHREDMCKRWWNKAISPRESIISWDWLYYKMQVIGGERSEAANTYGCMLHTMYVTFLDLTIYSEGNA